MKHTSSAPSENVIWLSHPTEKTQPKPESPTPPEKPYKHSAQKAEDIRPKRASKKPNPIEFFSEAIKTALAPTDWQATYANRAEKKNHHLISKNSAANMTPSATQVSNDKELDKLEEQLSKLKHKENNTPLPQATRYDPFEEDDLL